MRCISMPWINRVMKLKQGGCRLVSLLPMLEQRIPKHNLININSVLEISKLILFSMCFTKALWTIVQSIKSEAAVTVLRKSVSRFYVTCVCRSITKHTLCVGKFQKYTLKGKGYLFIFPFSFETKTERFPYKTTKFDVASLILSVDTRRDRWILGCCHNRVLINSFFL